MHFISISCYDFDSNTQFKRWRIFIEQGQRSNQEIFEPCNFDSSALFLKSCVYTIGYFRGKMLDLEIVPERSLGCEQWEFVLGRMLLKCTVYL